nr:hypothetical protein [Kofleriaceae bacterium]
MKAVFVTTALAAMTATAAASPATDAIAKHEDAAVASLRAHADDPAARCTLGAVYAARGDLSRADLYLAGCDAAPLDADLADAVARATRDTAKKLRDSDLAGIDIDVQPERAGGYAAEVDALPGERFTAPRMVWVPAGHHVVRVFDATGRGFESSVDTAPHSRGPLLVVLDTPATPPPRNGSQDFTTDQPVDAPIAGAPKDVKHAPLKIHVLEAHQATDDAQSATVAPDDQIADPLETHRTESALGFGARVGGGVFEETGGPSRVGPSLAALASVRLHARVALDLRVDWTRRGSDGTDAIGVTLGPTVTAVQLPSLAVRAGGGLRADLRLESSIVYFPPQGKEFPMLAEVANDANVSAAAWLEVPLRAWPVTLGARFERSLTTLGFGVHDQAVILEAGWELR